MRCLALPLPLAATPRPRGASGAGGGEGERRVGGEVRQRGEEEQLRRLEALQTLLFEMLVTGREEEDELVKKMEAAANLAELDRVDQQRSSDKAHLAEHWQHEQFAHSGFNLVVFGWFSSTSLGLSGA